MPALEIHHPTLSEGLKSTPNTKGPEHLSIPYVGKPFDLHGKRPSFTGLWNDPTAKGWHAEALW